MVNPRAMESRYRDRPESNSRQNFARFTGTRVNSRVPEKNALSDFAISDKIHVSLGAYLDVRANRVTIKYERAL